MSQPESSAPTRGELTANAIRQAIVRIEKGRPKIVKPGCKLSIKSVAEEAGVSRATIHNNHPALAERIREAGNKVARTQRDEKNEELRVQRAKYKELLQENRRIRELNQDMASEMATLEVENRRLRAMVESKNVIPFSTNKPKRER